MIITKKWIKIGFEDKFKHNFFTVIFARGVELIVVNNESLSPQEEMIQDLISIIHVFSCKIYGLRKYKKKIEEDDEICSEDIKQKSIPPKNKK